MRASQGGLVIKNPPANARDIRDVGSIPGSGRPRGGGHGNPLQYSYLENSMDRGVWHAIVHRVTKSRTQLKRLSTHSQDSDEILAPHYFPKCVSLSNQTRGNYLTSQVLLLLIRMIIIILTLYGYCGGSMG